MALQVGPNDLNPGMQFHLREIPAEKNGRNLFSVRNNTLGEKKSGRKLAVLSRGAHRDRQCPDLAWMIAETKPDFERLFHCHRVGLLGVNPAVYDAPEIDLPGARRNLDNIHRHLPDAITMRKD